MNICVRLVKNVIKFRAILVVVTIELFFSCAASSLIDMRDANVPQCTDKDNEMAKAQDDLHSPHIIIEICS